MSSNRSRIAKNTLMLYIRHILTMLVGLVTVRVVLDNLGIEDFGIYNIVGGFVFTFTFLKHAMAQSTQRFLNFAMGQGDIVQAKNVYSISIIIHILIALISVVLAETLGLWFFHTFLNIPPLRKDAALFAYHLSVAAMAINILSIPYRATIIAYEKFSFFAFISIIESLLKLGIVLLLPIIFFDKLISYAFLLSLISFVVFLIHKVYCNRKFEIARFRYYKDKQLFRSIAGFSAWNAFGSFANDGRSRGADILLNIFHGVTLNAAMGIGKQVHTAVYSFVSQFQTAFRPQLIKSYAAKDYDDFMRLLFQTSKASFFLLFIFVLPLYLNTDFVFQIWLNTVPEYAVFFTRLMLLNSLEMALSGPLTVAVHAAGNLKKYQLVTSFLLFANLPVIFLLLWMGYNPASVLIVKIIIGVLILAWRIIFLKSKIELPVIKYFKEVVIPIIIITGISILINTPFIIYFIGWTKLILSTAISGLSIIFLVYFFVLNAEEKALLKKWIKKWKR